MAKTSMELLRLLMLKPTKKDTNPTLQHRAAEKDKKERAKNKAARKERRRQRKQPKNKRRG